MLFMLPPKRKDLLYCFCLVSEINMCFSFVLHYQISVQSNGYVVLLLKLAILCFFSGILISSQDASMWNTRKVASMCSVRYCSFLFFQILLLSNGLNSLYLSFSCFTSEVLRTYSTVVHRKYDEKKSKLDLFIDVRLSL